MSKFKQIKFEEKNGAVHVVNVKLAVVTFTGYRGKLLRPEKKKKKKNGKSRHATRDPFQLHYVREKESSQLGHTDLFRILYQ
jgi:hypothetical protein